MKLQSANDSSFICGKLSTVKKFNPVSSSHYSITHKKLLK